MNYDILAALAVFALVSSITPGPNNLMLLASGANFGWRRTLPHLLGVTLGFVFLAGVLGLGLLRALQSDPATFAWLRGLCAVFVLYLAWKIATSASLDGRSTGIGRPLRFVEALAFQWINPKAVIMALTTVTTYAADPSFAAVIFAVFVFGCVNFPSCGTWVLVGERLQTWLRVPGRLRLFNIVMALLLVASMVPVLLDPRLTVPS